MVETQYCITVGRIPEEFYPEISVNEAQREEWVQLFSIDQIQGDQVTPGYSKKLKLEFLQAHPTLVVDTQHFPCSFVDRLIDNTALVTEVSGVLFIPSFYYQMTPKISLNIRCSISISKNLSINGRTRSSGQLGIWSYNINP